jgi:hypothetical protein
MVLKPNRDYAAERSRVITQQVVVRTEVWRLILTAPRPSAEPGAEDESRAANRVSAHREAPARVALPAFGDTRVCGSTASTA